MSTFIIDNLRDATVLEPPGDECNHGGTPDERKEGDKEEHLIFIDPPLHIHTEKVMTPVFLDPRASGPPVSDQEIADLVATLNVSATEMRRLASAEQRTPEWHAARRNRIGASRSYAATGKFYKAPYAEVVEGCLWGSTLAASFACKHGTEKEPLCEAAAIEGYKAQVNAKVREENAALQAQGRTGEFVPHIVDIQVAHEGTLIWPRHPMFNASIDGVAFVRYSDGKWDCFGCEWKCPLIKHGYRGSVPVEYYWQMQQQLTIYEDSGHLMYMLTERGINVETDMVPGWKWRSMFGVWQNGIIIQRQFVPFDKPAFMAHAQKVRHIYMTQYMPRWVRKERGEVQCPCIDWAPDIHVGPQGDTVLSGEEEEPYCSVSEDEGEVIVAKKRRGLVVTRDMMEGME